MKIILLVIYPKYHSSTRVEKLPVQKQQGVQSGFGTVPSYEAPGNLRIEKVIVQQLTSGN